MEYEKILFKNMDNPDSHRIDSYIANDGYKALEKTLRDYKPEEVVEIIKKSGLRGRGGAGFPTGIKWSFVPKNSNKPVYLCCNADEGEPGTFKDRQIIERDPHLLIEGIIISSYAIGAHKAFIYIRGEYQSSTKILDRAISEAYEKGFMGRNILKSGFDLDLAIHRGAGSYECGEETALMESIEGKRGIPRLKPPFPAQIGLYGSPTVINNVETLSNVSHIILKGWSWYRNFGTEKSPGTKIFSVSGHVNKPGNYELPLGITLRELLDVHAGGIRRGKKLKAVIPGGSSTPVLTDTDIDVKMDFESLANAGSSLGSGGVIVMDENTCMVKVATNLAYFYHHESCGKCTPCREGTGWLYRILRRIEEGKGREEDLPLLEDICNNILAKSFCPLGDGAVGPVLSTIQRFRNEYESHIKGKRC